MKRDTKEEDHQKEDRVSPSDKCFICQQPVGHHLLKCNKDTLQDNLKEVVLEVPVEPLTGPPKIVHPFPPRRPQNMLMPSPLVQANFTIKVNKVAKMKTGPASNEAKMLTAMVNQPQVMMWKLSPEEIKSLSSSV